MADGARPATDQSAADDRRRWFFRLLIVATFLQAATAVARPMASYRALEVGMAPGTLGLVAAAFAIAPVIFALSIGRRIDRHGEFPFLIGATLLQAASSVALIFIGDALALLLGIAVLGLSQLVFVVANQTLVASRSAVGDYDQRFSSLSFVASLGQLIGPAAAGLIAGSTAAGAAPQLGTSGTGWALLFGAVLSVLAVPLILFQWRRDPGHVVAKRAEGAPEVSIRSILRMPGMGPAMLASLTVLATMDILTVYLPALGEERGIPVATIGALLAVRAGASMVSRFFLARSIVWFGRERLLLGSLVLAAGSVFALSVLPLPLMFALMVVAGLTLGVGQPMTMSWVAARATPESRGTAMSLRLMGNRVGQVIIPLAAGSVAAVTGAAGVLAATGLTIAASAAIVGSRRPRPSVREETRTTTGAVGGERSGMSDGAA